MRFHGVIGYGVPEEKPPNSGVWEDVLTEVSYTGDVIRNMRRLEDGEGINSDFAVSNSISVVADQYAVEHFMYIKYVEWAGVFWTVTTVEVRSPRLLLGLGQVYNGPRAQSQSEDEE